MFSLYEALKMGLQVCAKNDVRYFLNGVRVIKNNDICEIQATNGHMLFRCGDIHEDAIIGDHDMIIPREEIEVILKLGKEIVLENRSVNNFKITPIDGIFPQNFDEVSKDETASIEKTAYNLNYINQICKAMKVVSSPFAQFYFLDEQGKAKIKFKNYAHTYFVIMPMRLFD